ncbi:hypothetical protein Q9R46_02890 [Paenibacillus sp. RRE4]|uniref:hypothetical protein n=1 Tax=Paenibacillus sp. RRE4 TaxID=2962587 RepID=UPI002882B9F8|nr:hypothetical protein [Paenibacillus sp. RRE4]MDT0121572.1 hypothetical protein [Paenibacillus sp. RRE4]
MNWIKDFNSIFKTVIDYLLDNAQWIFSGLGITIILGFKKFRTFISKTFKNLNHSIKKSRTQKTLIFDLQAYWKKSDLERKSPYCSRCWDVDKRLVHMTINNSKYKNYSCPQCKSKVTNDLLSPIKPLKIKSEKYENIRKKF